MPRGSAQVALASNGRNARVVHKQGDGFATGLLCYTVPYINKANVTNPFLAPGFGDDFSVDGSASGDTDLVHNGGDSAGWTGSAVSGTWDFADTTGPDTGTNHVSITDADDNNEGRFDRASTINGSSYEILRIRVNLQVYSAANNEMILTFDNAGTTVGVPMDIGSFIDTGDIGNYQTATIPLAELEIDDQTFDGCSITMTRTGGAKPTVYFDNIEFYESGGVPFTIQARRGGNFFIEGLQFQFIDNITGSTAKTYNRILNVDVGDGITINRTSRGGTVQGRPISSIADFIKFGAPIADASFLDDGTNTTLSFFLPFVGAPILLEGDFDDTITVLVAGDFSTLLQCNCYARGYSQPSKLEVLE